MKINLIQMGLLVGMGAIVIIFWSRMNEELVTESDTAPVSQLSFDEEVAKIPFETVTFGMG
ncbi:MAG: hypothetical protein ACSHX6_01900 [Akkermansiaceae bacterium]